MMASASNVTPPMAFQTAFDRLKQIVSIDDARSFNSTTMEDVWTTARDIERHLESRRSLRGFRRIQPFFAGLEQYSKVVEVICNGTPYMPYIWVSRLAGLPCNADIKSGTRQASPTGRCRQCFVNRSNTVADCSRTHFSSGTADRCLRYDRRGNATL